MYLAEFSFTGTAELATELLILAPSELNAKDFAQQYAHNWGIELFSFAPATEQQVHLYSRIGKTITLAAS